MLYSLFLITTHLDKNCFELGAAMTVLSYDFMVTYIFVEESIIYFLFILLFCFLFIDYVLKFTTHNIGNRLFICMPSYNRPI